MPEPIPPAPAAPAPVPPETETQLAPRPVLSVVTATPPLSELALGCLGEVDALIIPLFAAAPNPLVAALVGFKAGVELRECTDERRAEASRRAAVEECVVAGGTPLGFVENVLTCEVGAR